MRFRPLTRPLKAPRRARMIAALSLMTLLAGISLTASGYVSVLGALASLGLAAFLAFLAVIVAVYGLRYIWVHTGIGAGDAALALLWALPVIASAAGLVYVVTQTPSYPDLSTNVNNPPAFEMLANQSDGAEPLPLDAASPAERIRIQLAYPDITTVYIERPGWHLAEVLSALVRTENWRLARLDTDNGLEFEAEISMPGPLLLVSHDVAIRIVDDGEGSTIDVRSLSNMPMHDFGTNGRLLGGLVQQLVRTIDETPPPASDL